MLAAGIVGVGWWGQNLVKASAGAENIEFVAGAVRNPEKVKEFAAEEGPRSPFAMLDKDITRVLTTVLVATVVCNIGYTAIFADIASARGRDGRTRGLPSASVRRLF